MSTYPVPPSPRKTFSNDVKRSSPLVRFPARHASCVWILRESTAWLVLHGNHGWAHGDHRAARADAEWLSKNLGLPIRCMSS